MVKKAKTKFTSASRSQIFEQWLKEVQQTLEIVQYDGPIKQDKLFTFFHSLLDSLERKDVYQHFRILDEIIPVLREQNFSIQNILNSILKLRNLLIQFIIKSSKFSLGDQSTLTRLILNRFDDLTTFIQRSFALHRQLAGENEQSNPYTETNFFPAGIISVTGPRLEGKSFVNTYLCRLTGFSQDNFQSKEIWKDIISADDYPKLTKYFTKLYRNKTPEYSIQYQLKNEKGIPIPVSETGHIQYNREGKPFLVNSIILQNQEVNELQAALTYQKIRFRKLADMLNHFLVICDEKGKILDCNLTFTDLLGKDRSKLVGSQLLEWITGRNGHQINSFTDILQHFSKHNEVTLGLKNKQGRFTNWATRLEVTTDTKNKNHYILIGWRNDGFNPDFNERLKRLYESIKEIQLNRNTQLNLDKLLELAMRLIPNADAGSLLKIEPDGMHFVAARGYHLDQLKEVILFQGDTSRYLGNSSQIQMLQNDELIREIDEISKEARHILNNGVYEHLKKTGQLECIEKTLSGLIFRDDKPFALLNLDSHKGTAPFSHYDKYIFNIYLQNINLILKNFNLIRQLQESENKYRVLFENSPIPTVIHQGDRFQLVNQKFLELSEYSDAEIKKISIWQLVHPDDREILQKRAKERLEGKSPIPEYEFRAVTKSGKERHCKGFFSEISFLGKPAILAEILDMTETRSLEKQLIQAQKMETIGTITAGIAHDFNNILGALSPSAEMIMLNPTHPDTRQRAEVIYKMAQRAGQLTRQLMTFTRLDKTRSIPFNLNQLIQSSRHLIEKSVGVRVKLQLNLDQNLKSIKGDPNQFIQLLLNLIVNARDAMPEGGTLFIDTGNVKVDEAYQKIDSAFRPGWYVSLKIRDTGTGIPLKIRNKVFDPFFTTKKPGRGTGLGLSIVYGIVKKHAGVILVKSEVSNGTVFEIFLPVSDSLPVSPVSNEVPKAARRTRSILVVDDEKELREVMKIILTHLGYDIQLASTGKEALKIYRKQGSHIDLVILDYLMPGMSGLDVFEELRTLDPEVKVLVCTGYSDQTGLQELIKNGILGILPKPFTLQSVSEKLDHVFSQLVNP